MPRKKPTVQQLKRRKYDRLWRIAIELKHPGYLSWVNAKKYQQRINGITTSRATRWWLDRFIALQPRDADLSPIMRGKGVVHGDD